MHFRNDLFFSDVGNSRIRKVDTSSGFISTVAGGGTEGLGDGGLATNATFSSHPMRIAMDFNGNLFVADAHQNRIRRVDISTRFISTVAGNGIAGYSGDGGIATQASINSPHGVAVDRTGNVFVADLGNSRIRRVDSKTGIITTFAGNGNKGFSGDQEPAVTASLFSPISVEVDSNDNIHIVDHGNNRIRKVDAATGIITTVAGNGTEGFSGDGGPASEAEMSRPRDVVVDLEGGVFFADQVNNRVRKVDAATRIITTVAGSGVDGFSGDGGLATEAAISLPYTIALSPTGDLYICDCGNNRVRRVDSTDGVIHTIAGDGIYGYHGDGGSAVQARLALGKKS